MATTTNFGWETPDDTDLVKDGAAAMRTLGNSIDTSFVDLKGGTTGQVLSKASGTDLDFTWVAQDDSNAIQNAIVDAKGDLISATAADTPARLAVGTNGQVLTADSTQSTGLKWATPSSSTFVGAFVTKSANQSISNATGTFISFDTESFDTNGFHSNTVNNTRFTIPTGYAGKYLVTGILVWAANSSGQRVNYIFKNGSLLHLTTSQPLSASGATTAAIVSQVVNLAVGDYVELQGYQDSGGALNMTGVNSWDTNFSITYLGA